MRKEFQFKVKGHDINVVNSWIRGVKLYVDGDFSDQSRSFFANGKIYLIMKLPAEMLKNYYDRAWWIINQNPETDE